MARSKSRIAPAVKRKRLDIEVETAGRASRRSGPVCLRKVIDMVELRRRRRCAFCAGELGFAERLRGPWDGADAFGATYQWSLRASKRMAPEFLRIAVEHLRRCGWDQPVRAMPSRRARAGSHRAFSDDRTGAGLAR